ncbi:ABC transporter ATP-binding protein [Hyphobacterium sp. CCMP332]|uniref:ABC transporter ATP-binding protein n=1 Tax=Hyphobacterium sp. CCMP332 TaxID=2749086 RepID=UPI00164F04BD|nr:ABC transporter ATP-binding protein [Hyphobacterium sp. CCMP332]QNL17873.1 ABC transporter ATP-binding protein [Hyphobacterium sp. CCMP332]
MIHAEEMTLCMPTGRGLRRVLGPPRTILDRLSFRIADGECVGVIGPNGSGKSTLLRVIAGILRPDGGKLDNDASDDVSILAPGAAFDARSTGRENLFRSAVFQGKTFTEARKVQDSIIDFSEIGDYIDEPVATYSSGMKARLGFAMAIHLPTKVLCIDESLSAGDMRFRKKAADAIARLIGDGRTAIIVSHNENTICDLCNRVLVLNQGRLVYEGEPKEGFRVYKTLKATAPRLNQANPNVALPGREQTF